MHATYIIRKPLLTEKSTFAMNELNQYSFEVDRTATKPDIKKAIEALYRVHVESVRTVVSKGRTRRLKYGEVTEPIVKKAVVRLREGEKIELF